MVNPAETAARAAARANEAKILKAAGKPVVASGLPYSPASPRFGKLGAYLNSLKAKGSGLLSAAKANPTVGKVTQQVASKGAPLLERVTSLASKLGIGKKGWIGIGIVAGLAVLSKLSGGSKAAPQYAPQGDYSYAANSYNNPRYYS